MIKSSRLQLTLYLLASSLYLGSKPAEAENQVTPPTAEPAKPFPSSSYILALGPFLGGGYTDSNARIRHTTGYTVALERTSLLSDRGLSLGPRLELGNSFINTKESLGELRASSLYDNRLIGAGVVVRQLQLPSYHWFPPIYVSFMLGKAYSKILRDESGTRSFRQSEFEQLNGSWFQGELGASLPMQGKLAVNFALLGHRLIIDQSAAIGRYSGDAISADGSMSLLAGSLDNSKQKILPDRVRFDNLGLRLGLAVAF